ncbi:MerR family DNA-binding transcriptional regulator [Paenibacillus rhizoplanae]
MKISEVATKVGLPISTLRYYEKNGHHYGGVYPQRRE